MAAPRTRRAGWCTGLLVLALVAVAHAGGATYTCPMHPEVRRDQPGSCPRCAMALIATSDDRLEAYHLDVDATPPGVPAGRPVQLRFVVRDPRSGEPVPELRVVHERPLHLFVVSADLAWLDHVHPAPRGDGSFELRQTFPRRGRYHLIADFVPPEGPPQLLQRAIFVGGAAGPLRAASLPPREVDAARVGALRLRLRHEPLAASRPAALVLEVSELDGSEAVLEPYLGAGLHLLAVSADLVDVIHAHGDLARGGTGPVRVEVCFPRPGVYRVWAQVQRRGVVHTARFTVPVPAMAATRPAR